MPTVQVKAQLSTDDLLQAVKQLNEAELQRFAWQVIAMHAHLKAPSLSKNESNLISKINEGIPQDIQQRYDELIAKRQLETLTDEEYHELLELTDLVEKRDAKRVEYLEELACIRNTTLSGIMKELDIQAPAYG